MAGKVVMGCCNGGGPSQSAEIIHYNVDSRPDIGLENDDIGAENTNCGYMVSSKARGRGLATSMCEHSQEVAMKLGYKAMQFNLVATSNDGAVRLWNKLGFDTVGCLPKAFNHPSKGYVDALVMCKWLETE